MPIYWFSLSMIFPYKDKIQGNYAVSSIFVRENIRQRHEEGQEVREEEREEEREPEYMNVLPI